MNELNQKAIAKESIKAEIMEIVERYGLTKQDAIDLLKEEEGNDKKDKIFQHIKSYLLGEGYASYRIMLNTHFCDLEINEASKQLAIAELTLHLEKIYSISLPNNTINEWVTIEDAVNATYQLIQ